MILSNKSHRVFSRIGNFSLTTRTFAVLGFLLGSGSAVLSAEPGAVLGRAKEAAGGSAWDSVRTAHSRLTLETGGIKGTAETWEDILQGRHYSTFSLGPVTGAEGWDGQAGWTRDSSGQTKKMEGSDEVEGAVDEAYRRCLAYWYTNRWPAKIESAGFREEGGREFEVVRINPKGGRPFELWVDRSTWLIDRTVEKRALETRTVFFSDYRDVEGKRTPFVLRSSNGESRYDQYLKAESISFNAPVDETKYQMPAPPPPDFTFAPGTTTTVIPFELINNHIYMQVKLNGQGPFKVLCDTGGANVVTPSVVARLGVKSEGALQGRGVGEQSEDVAITKLDTLSVGDVTLRDQVFMVFPMESLADVEGVPQNGLVGYEVFKRFVVKIDYEQSRLTLILPSTFKYQGTGTIVPFRFNSHIPQVDGSIDGVAGKFDIDTGSRSSVSLLKPFAEKNDLRAKLAPGFEAVTGWGIGGPARGLMTRARELRLGDVVVTKPVTEISQQQKGALTDPYVAGNVGAGVLKRFNLIFDYDGKRLIFEPNPNNRQPDVYDRSGMWLNRAAEGLKIFDVTARGPAETAGLKTGDLIVAVDGTAVTENSLVSLRRRFRAEPPGTRIQLTLESNGTKRDTTLVLKDLL